VPVSQPAAGLWEEAGDRAIRNGMIS